MTPKIYVYACSDPDCPDDLRFVAHWFAPTVARKGSPVRLALQVATSHGRTVSEARTALAAFLNKEAQRVEARRRKAEATSERIKAYHERRRAAK